MALRDLLIKVAGDNDDARRAIAEVAKDGAEFSKQQYEAIISVDAQLTALNRAKQELQAFGRISVEAAAGVEIVKGEAQIDRLKTRIENLSKQEASPKVEAQTTKALLALDRVQARVDKLKAAHAEISIDVDRGPVTIIDAITGAVGGLLGAIGGGGGGLSGATTRISAGFISFGAASGPLAAILAALAATIGVALVGALAALAASLAAAVAALGVLAVALAGALGPVLAVVIAAVVRFAKVIQALRAQSAAAQQAQQAAAAGSSAVTAAAEQQEAAARALTTANERLEQATTQAYREMADAAAAATTAVLTLEQAQEGTDQANLNTRKSVQDLAELRKELGATGAEFDNVFKKFSDVNVDLSGLKGALAAARGSTGGGGDAADQLKLEQAVLNVRTARTAEKVAINSVATAETNLTRTRQRANEFAREGINASDGYTAALRGVADAQRQVNAASKAQDLAAAQAKAKILTDDLSDSERKLLVVLQQVGKAFRDALGPATDAVAGGLAGALGNIAKLVTALKPAFTAIGAAIAQALTVFSGELVKPEWIAALTTLALAGAQLTGIFTADLLIPFLQILRDVAIAALPLLISGLQAFGDLLKGLSDDTSADGLSGTFEVLVEHLKSWLQLGLAIGAVFLALFKGSAGPGKQLVDALASGARELAKWLNSKAGMTAIREFFAATLPLVASVGRFVAALVVAFLQFAQFAAPAVTVLFDVLTFLIKNIKTIALILLPIGVLFGSTFAIAAAAVLIVVAIIKNFPKILAALGTAVAKVGAFFTDAFNTAKNAASSAIDFITSTFNGFVDAAKSIGKRIGNGIAGGIKSALGTVVGVAKGMLNGVISVMNGVITGINKITPGEIKALGKVIFPGIPDIPQIPKLGDGGLAIAPALREIGDRGREAVLPLTRRVFGELADGIVAQMRLPAASLRAPSVAFAAAGAGASRDGGGTHIDHVDVVLKTASGGVPDAKFASRQLAEELARMG